MGTVKKLQNSTFAQVAELIVSNGVPAWLPAHLEWWAQGVGYDWNLERSLLPKLKLAGN